MLATGVTFPDFILLFLKIKIAMKFPYHARAVVYVGGQRENSYKVHSFQIELWQEVGKESCTGNWQ